MDHLLIRNDIVNEINHFVYLIVIAFIAYYRYIPAVTMLRVFLSYCQCEYEVDIKMRGNSHLIL